MIFKSIGAFLALGLTAQQDRNSMHDWWKVEPVHEPGRVRAARAKREAQARQAKAAAKRKAAFVARYNANPMNFLPGVACSIIYSRFKDQRDMERYAARYIKALNEKFTQMDDLRHRINWPVPGFKLPPHLQGM